MAAEATNASGRRRLGVALAAAAIVLVLAASRRLPLTALLEWVRATGPLGMMVYVVAYALACVALVPASLLTLAAGFVYGPWTGTLLVSPASVLGATLAFLVGRKLGRAWVLAKLGDRPLFRAIDQAIGGQGFRVVALLRLSPVFPFNLLNYALSLTRVRLRDYLLGSWLGMLPGTFLYVYLGSLASSLTALAQGEIKPSAGRTWLLALGLVATVVVTTLVTRRARKALAAELV